MDGTTGPEPNGRTSSRNSIVVEVESSDSSSDSDSEIEVGGSQEDDGGNDTDWTISIPNSPEQGEEEKEGPGQGQGQGQRPILPDSLRRLIPHSGSGSRSPPPVLNNSPVLRRSASSSQGSARENASVSDPTMLSAKRLKMDIAIPSDDEDDMDSDEFEERGKAFAEDLKQIMANGSTEFTPRIQQKQRLFLDLKKLWASKELSDIVFKCDDGEVKAHKLIVAARSDVFNAMFSSGMSESTTNVCKIYDVKLNIMKLLVEYMYTGSVEPLSVPDTCDLIRAADKYQLVRLKIACFKNLVKKMKETNVGDFIMLAHTHNAPDSIKLKMQKYIVQKRAELWNVSEFREVAEANSEVMTVFVFDSFVPPKPGQYQ